MADLSARLRDVLSDETLQKADRAAVACGNAAQREAAAIPDHVAMPDLDKREGISMRALILGWLKEWVNK